MRRLIVVAACVGVSALFAAPAFGAPPRVEVSSGSGALGKATSVTVDLALADAGSAAPSGFVLYAPPGYQAQLGQAPGAAVGEVQSASMTVDGSSSQVDAGSIVATDPVVDPANPSLVACPAGAHSAVWLINLATPAGSVQVPLVVDAVNSGPESGYASLRIEACPTSDVALSALTLTLDGVFTNPSLAAVYTWRVVAVPGADASAAAVESRALVPLPVELSLHGSYDLAHGVATLTGSLTAAGEPVGGQAITLYAGSKPGPTARSGSATTGFRGAFSAKRTMSATTYFRASASVDAKDVTATGCADPIAPGGCVSATRGPLAAQSASIRVVVPPPPELSWGSRGVAVRLLQEQLSRLRYLPSGWHSGVFDDRTWHAVVAFQGWTYLGRTGVVDRRTWNALEVAGIPQPFGGMEHGVEIDVSRQVLLLVDHGITLRAIHVSTAAPGHYTPRGHFHIYLKQILSWSVPFKVWMPYANYFYGGFAVHGLASVPAYPASHGCVRLPMVEAPGVYTFTTIGMPLWIR